MSTSLLFTGCIAAAPPQLPGAAAPDARADADGAEARDAADRRAAGALAAVVAGTGAPADPVEDGRGQQVDQLEGGVHQPVGDDHVEREHGEEADRPEPAGGARVAHLGQPHLVEEADAGEEDEVAEDQPEQHQRRAQDQRRQEQPALAGGVRDEPVAVLAGDVGGRRRR